MSGLGFAIALFLRRLRYLHRLAWHKLTGRWPRYRWRNGWDGELYLSKRERSAFRALAASYRARGSAACDPGYDRKRQQ